MNSVYFALVVLAIAFVIAWSVRSDGLPPEVQWGPFAMRRPSEARRQVQSGRESAERR